MEIGNDQVDRRVLLVERDPQLVRLIKEPLEQEGYEIVVVRDSSQGLELARQVQPRLIILDFAAPEMPGNELASALRQDPTMDHITILMIADEEHLEDLKIGREGNADDFLIKPFGPLELVTKVRSLTLSEDRLKRVTISTGNGELDSKMGGGLSIGSLTLIEGDSGAGKSVLSQQMIQGCLEDGYKLTLFSSENTMKGLVKQMRSLNLDIRDYLLLGKLRVFPIAASLGVEAPALLIKAVMREQEGGCDIIFVDSLTSSITDSSESDVVAFFEGCRGMCSRGTTMTIVVHSYGLTNGLLTRLRSLCDAHLQLRTESVGNKLIKTLEVTKVRGAEQNTDNVISFEIEPGWGMRVIPMSKVKG